jgi:hypothetical protein
MKGTQMSPSSSLVDALTDYLASEPNAILFAGAGISAAAGLPTWENYLRILATKAQKDDKMTSEHMAHRLDEGDLLGAADLYFISKKIPQPEKFKFLTEPLQTPDSEVLEQLMKLPFKAVVTSNFDRALFNAYAAARGKAAQEVNLNDPSLAAATFNSDFYVARIHGRIEVPDSIQLSERHFSELSKNLHYQDFLGHLFSRERILFVGFSFLDPAIRNVLEIVEANVGKYHAGRHLALLPKGAPGELIRELEKFSIRRLEYDPDGHHRSLWQQISTLSLVSIGAKRTTKQAAEDPFRYTRKYLSACYARMSLGTRALPLRQSVVEGIVSAVICESGESGITEEAIGEAVSSALTLTKVDTAQLVDNALISLLRDSLVRQDPSGVRRYVSTMAREQNSYANSISKLVDGVLDRYIVRGGGKDSGRVRECLRRMFDAMVVRRGWDLGVAFASGQHPEQVDLHTMFRSIDACAKEIPPVELRELGRATENLFQHPNQEEAGILIEMGRTSFALELVSRSPRDTLLHQLTLPSRIYLDANVLMPAIVPGHPFYEVYRVAIKKLVDAAAMALSPVEIVAYRGFLNEIVSHRRLAVEQMSNSDNADFARLRREAQLFGTYNMNVYVSGFANTLANDKSLTFAQFMALNAPYSSEIELAKWLSRIGIFVEEERTLKTGASQLPEILHALEKANAAVGWRKKDGTLVQHDAVQVAALARDLRLGKRTVFVSADRKLKDHLSSHGLGDVANGIMSHIGLTQLVDLLIGTNEHERGLATLFWGSRVSDDTEQVRNYLIDSALGEYDQAVAMRMADVVDDIADDAAAEIQKSGLSLDDPRPASRSRVLSVLDGFEEKFMSGMRAAIEKDRGRAG